MNQVDVKFGEWLEKGFALYKEGIGTLIVAALLVLVISSATLGILAGPMLAGYVLIVLRLKDKTEPKPAIGDVFQGFNYFLQAFLFMIVYFVVMFVAATVLGFIPVIGGLASIFVSYAVATLVLFAMFLIVDKKMDFWPACQASIDQVKTNFWPFLGFTVVITVISMLGAIACLIGIIVTLPFYYCAIAVAYRDVYGENGNVVEPQMDTGSAPPPVPPA